jgi:hypothetical protein
MFQFMSTVFLPLKSSPDSLDSVIGKIHPGIKKQQANVVAFASMNGGVTRAYARYIRTVTARCGESGFISLNALLTASLTSAKVVPFG